MIIDEHIHQEDSPATVTIYPPNVIENKYPITLVQHSPILAVCPHNRRVYFVWLISFKVKDSLTRVYFFIGVLYLFTKSDKPSAKDDLMQALKTVANIPEDGGDLGKSGMLVKRSKYLFYFPLHYYYENAILLSVIAYGQLTNWTLCL